jgi:hypothetical protein
MDSMCYQPCRVPLGLQHQTLFQTQHQTDTASVLRQVSAVVFDCATKHGASLVTSGQLAERDGHAVAYMVEHTTSQAGQMM